MSKTLCLMIFCLLMSVPINAQDGYQLREPTLNDYLQIASEGIGRCGWDQDHPFSPSPWDLCAYLLNQIQILGQQSLGAAPFDILMSAYNNLEPISDSYFYSPGNSYLWHEALVFAWLRDHPINLDFQPEFTVGDIHVDVTPRDFNADGKNEYVLKVRSSWLETFFVAQRDPKSTYTPVSVSLPYHDVTAPYFFEESNYLEEIAFDDFNADGLPEWLLAFDGAYPYGQDLGSIYLIGWRDGELKGLTKSGIKHIPGFETNAAHLSDESIQNGYMFRNLDDDPALELEGIEITSDNWGCSQTSTRVYDWDAAEDGYNQVKESINRPETANCVIDAAELALFNQDYTAAADLYEYGRTLPVDEGPHSDGSTFDAEIPQYIQLRLAQAYVLNREYEAADSVLDALVAQDMASEMLSQMRAILLMHRQSPPAETCTALYNLFKDAVDDSVSYDYFLENVGTDLTIGLKEKYHTGMFADPSFAGCNVLALLDPFLSKGFYGYQGTPLEQLQASGFKISESLRADFNGDGKNDWLIWVDAHVPAVLVLDQGENKPFTILRADIPHVGDQATAVAVSLPDDAGVGLILFRTRETIPSYYSVPNCGTSVSALGEVNIFRYKDDTLKLINNTSWCDDSPTVDEIFGTIDSESVFYAREQGIAVPYFWRAETKRYEPQGTVASAAIPTAQPQFSNEDLYMMLGDGIGDYYDRLDQQIKEAKNVDEAIAILNAEINADYVDSSLLLQFWKATLLREAGRDDEALAAYAALYKTNPESVWGRMAAVYFEPLKEE